MTIKIKPYIIKFAINHIKDQCILNNKICN